MCIRDRHETATYNVNRKQQALRFMTIFHLIKNMFVSTLKTILGNCSQILHDM